MENLINVFLAILVVFILIPAGIYFIFKPMVRQSRILKGVENYDALMRKFIFRVDMSKAEFFAVLRQNDSSDVLMFHLKDESTIVFEKDLVKMTYGFSVEELDGFIVLRVQQAHSLHSKTNIPYFVNEFWITKVGAKPLPFSSYPF